MSDHEMRSMTVNGKRYDSFPDRTARENMLPRPEQTAAVGQYLTVGAVDEAGAITRIDLAEGSAAVGTGLTSAEKNLMLTLLKATPYLSDVSAAVRTLESIWTGGSGSAAPDVPGVERYSVTCHLSGVRIDDAPADIVAGGSLTVDLIPDTNAVLGEVVVTMGGADVTAGVYSGGKISISSVTGDVVITASAAAANYTQVEYLQGDGVNNGAWLNTGYCPAAGDLVEVTFAVTKVDWDYIFSSYALNRGTYSLITRANFEVSTGFTRSAQSLATNSNARVSLAVSERTVYTFKETEAGTGTLYDADGNALVTLSDPNVATFTEPTNPIFLFCQSNGTSPYGAARKANRIYSFRIRDVYGNSRLDLIPVLDANGVACMYDKVSGNFIYDASGQNAFIAGGAV